MWNILSQSISHDIGSVDQHGVCAGGVVQEMKQYVYTDSF